MAPCISKGRGPPHPAAHVVAHPERTSRAVSWPGERHRLVADPRVRGAGERHAVHAHARDRDLRGAGAALRPGHLLVLGRGRAGPRDRVPRALRAGPRRLPWGRVGDVVRRRPDQPGPSMRGPVVRGDPGRARRRVGGRGRRHADVDLRRAPAADGSTRASAPRARGRGGRRGRDLPADAAGDRRRGHGLLQDRRHLGPDLQRVRSRRGRGPARGCRCLGPPDGRCLPSEGPRRPDARRGAERRRPRGHGPRDRRPAARGRGRRSGGARLGEPGRGRVGRAPPLGAAGQRASPVHRVHERHDRHDRRGSCTSTAGSS